MSTVARLDEHNTPPAFTLVFSDPLHIDDPSLTDQVLTVCHEESGGWYKHASVQPVDQINALVTHRLLHRVIVHTGGRVHLLQPPAPVPFFAGNRMRTAICSNFEPYSYDMLTTDETVHPDHDEWLYTYIGYLLPEYRVYMTILPTHVEMHVESRSTPFSFV